MPSSPLSFGKRGLKASDPPLEKQFESYLPIVHEW